jgi:opacity protein-like surface antigen
LLISAPPVFGSEITFGVDSAYIRESNFYRTTFNEVAADSVEVTGRVTAAREEGRLQYLASYQGSYQDYSDQEGASAPEHRLRLSGSYDIDQRTTFSLDNRYRDVQNLRFSPEDILDGDSGLEPNSQRYRRNNLEMMLRRALTRTWELEVDASHQFIDFEDNTNRVDSTSYQFGTRVFYRFAPRHRFGGGVSYLKQDYDGSQTRLDAEAEYLVTDLAWSFDIADQVELRVFGGPAWIRTRESDRDEVIQQQFVGTARGDEVFRANVLSCGFDENLGTGIASLCGFETPGAPPISADDLGEFVVFPLDIGPHIGEDDDVVLFGGVRLLATLSDWTIDAEIHHQPNATTGDAGAVSLSRFRWQVGYTLGQSNWDAYIAGSWESREAITETTRLDFVVVPGLDNAAQRETAFTSIRDPDDRRLAFTGLVGLRKQFSRSLSASVSYRYRRTEQRVSGRDTFYDYNFLVIQASYDFDSFRL